MQRDIGNELVVAIIAVGILAFALTFGIILSLSSSNQGNRTAVIAFTEEPATQISAIVESNAPTATATSTVVPLTQTPAKTAVIPTNTPFLPTERPSSTAETSTNTPVESTAAPLATSRSSDVTTAPTNTAIVPTHTLLPTLTFTPEPSNTPEPTATTTEAPTSIPLPTATTTEAPTSIPLPTATVTKPPTRTPEPTNTPTIQPTVTREPSNMPTHAPTVTRTPIPTLDLSVCVAPYGWSAYIVQLSDSLASIARASGSNINDLRAANCLSASDRPSIGDILYVPRLTESLAEPMEMLQENLSLLGCTDAGVQISSPLAGQRVGEVFVLSGTALTNSFLYFKVEVRPDFATVYDLYALSDRIVENGPLTQINTAAFTAGLHWIRLSVIDENDRASATPCILPVYFD